MLLFSCTDCKEMINCPDHENAVEILYILVEHVNKCPPATFTCEGTTDAAEQRLYSLRSLIAAAGRLGEKLQLHWSGPRG
jgi:hypothetical protein